jgi:membrane-bound ClpP family serine protease
MVRTERNTGIHKENWEFNSTCYLICTENGKAWSANTSILVGTDVATMVSFTVICST